MRYANVYGPRQNPYGEAGVVAIFCKKFVKGKKLVINGDGKQTRDFVFVSDVVKANLKALDFQGSEIFNIGTAKETDVNTIFAELKKIFSSSFSPVHGPAKAGEQQTSCLSFKKAKKKLGWQPEVSLEKGLKLTVKFFHKQ